MSIFPTECNFHILHCTIISYSQKSRSSLFVVDMYGILERYCSPIQQVMSKHKTLGYHGLITSSPVIKPPLPVAIGHHSTTYPPQVSLNSVQRCDIIYHVCITVEEYDTVLGDTSSYRLKYRIQLQHAVLIYLYLCPGPDKLEEIHTSYSFVMHPILSLHIYIYISFI